VNASMRRSLRLGRRTTEARSASLALHVKTEGPYLADRPGGVPFERRFEYGAENVSGFWSLEIDVDESSGEDGASAPSLHIPIRAGSGLPAHLEDLAGHRIDDRNTPGLEGWYGNDAPPIEDNVFIFGAWLAPDLIAVEWTGTYDDWYGEPRERAAFAFQGTVQFRGVIMTVKDEVDAEPCFAAMFPDLAASELILTKGGVIDYGPGMQAYRRRWISMVWTRPGATPAMEDLDPFGTLKIP
jgi:hypothetical protein